MALLNALKDHPKPARFDIGDIDTVDVPDLCVEGIVRPLCMKVPQARLIGNPGPFQFEYSMREVFTQYAVERGFFVRSEFNFAV